MSEQTAISWTEATWNPTTGCDRVSPGCANCYALAMAKRLKAAGNPRYQKDGGPASGPGFGLTVHPDLLDLPLRWRKPRLVFVNSMSDLFHEDVPDAFIEQVFITMARRVEGHRKRGWEGPLPFDHPPYPLPNVWLGVSVENQRQTWRIDELLRCPAVVHFISGGRLLDGRTWDEVPDGGRLT